MSDRLNLWPGRHPTCEVNLDDHPNMESAVKAFANHQQVLNVYGPRHRISECQQVWGALVETEMDFPAISAVHWVPTDTPWPKR